MMACYERFDWDYPRALIEQNIFDDDELSSQVPVFCHPLKWDNPTVNVLVVEPMVLVYQEIDEKRWYALQPISWHLLIHDHYHLVSADLHHALTLKSTSAKRHAILEKIRICENRIEMEHIIN
jgi:hypothetical protein